ncbi:glycoside hydrolase family 2 protein [Flammeovirga pectinis]|nr:glycoside hydrolase family 2 TIM barrel-domain containing protein [Flammeovirga pectinis]
MQLQFSFAQRKTIDLNDEKWFFHKGELGGIWEVLRPINPIFQVKWTEISLPHTYNTTDILDSEKEYYQGVVWYKVKINLNEILKEDRYFLRFENIGNYADIYIDTEKIGCYNSVYTPLELEITDKLREKSFYLTLRVDNSRRLKLPPSDLNDYYLSGGILGNLKLLVKPKVHYESLIVQTDYNLQNKRAYCKVIPKIINDVDTSLFYSQFVISSLNDSLINKFNSNINEFDLKLNQLWSPNNPKLFKFEAQLISKKTNVIIDKVEKIIGFKKIELRENNFFLNGKRVLIKGVSRHSDQFLAGAAEKDVYVEREFNMIKSMGANFIRLGHYPASSKILQICDSLGIMVWEEISWSRSGYSGGDQRIFLLNQLKSMIYNHSYNVSIIAWGLGNELDMKWKESSISNIDKTNNLLKEFIDTTKKFDSTRFTSIRRFEKINNNVDLYSPSLWPGWYSNNYTDYKRLIENNIKKYSNFFHAEWGASSIYTRHSENPYIHLMKIDSTLNGEEIVGAFLNGGGFKRPSKDGDWSETYQCDLIDWILKEQLNLSNFTGSAYWAFKDFPTPLRPNNPIPYMNLKGLTTRDLQKKDAFYVFQSYWATKPMVRIYSHTWKNRWGSKNEKKMIKVYSNCDSVELFKDGVLIGVKKRDIKKFPCSGLFWNVKLRNKSDNLFKAVGYKNGVVVHDEVLFHYVIKDWGVPNDLVCKIEKDQLKMKVIDSKGKFCLDADNFIMIESLDKKNIQNKGVINFSNKAQLINGCLNYQLKSNDDHFKVTVFLEDNIILKHIN